MNNMHVPELTPKVTDFDKNVCISFKDGSLASFNYAFGNYEDDFFVVYTKDNGYHTFPRQNLLLARTFPGRAP